MDLQATPLDSQGIPATESLNEQSVVGDPVPQIDPKLQEARERERSRVSREEKLRNELEQTRAQYDQLETARQALLSNGWDINTLLTVKNQQISNVNNPEIEDLKSQINNLKKDLTAKEQERVNERRRKEVVSFVKDNEDKFELIKAHELEGEVIGLIDEHYKKTKKLLSYEEAAEKIEEHLEKETEKILSKVKSTKKVKKVLGDFSVSDVKVPKSSGVLDKKVEKVVDTDNDGLDDLREIVKQRHKSSSPMQNKPDETKVKAKTLRESKLDELIKKYT